MLGDLARLVWGIYGASTPWFASIIVINTHCRCGDIMILKLLGDYDQIFHAPEALEIDVYILCLKAHEFSYCIVCTDFFLLILKCWVHVEDCLALLCILCFIFLILILLYGDAQSRASGFLWGVTFFFIVWYIIRLDWWGINCPCSANGVLFGYYSWLRILIITDQSWFLIGSGFFVPGMYSWCCT